jgi:hypothetical protein
MRLYTLQIQRGADRIELGQRRTLSRSGAERWAAESALRNIGSSKRWSWKPTDDNLERVIISDEGAGHWSGDHTQGEA